MCVENFVELVVVNVRHRDEVTLVLVLYKKGLKVLYVAVAEEYLAFAVLYIFLYVERYCLRQAEVFHIVGYGNAQFFAECKEMVNCVARQWQCARGWTPSAV